MTKGLDRYKFSKNDIQKLRRERARPVEIGADPIGTEKSAQSDVEHVARAFLRDLAIEQSEPVFRSLGMEAVVGGQPPEVTTGPHLVMKKERLERITDTDLVSFEQMKDDIPVFGSRVVVEMDSHREVISASMDVVSVDGVNTQETTSAAEARAILSGMLEAQEPGQVPEPVKTIFPHPEEDGALHLAWHFKNVPLYPHQADGENEAGDDDLDHGVCCGSSPLLEADFDYFIDAQNGELIYLFPNSAHIDIPSRCQGEDEDGFNQIFFGRMDGSDFIMENPFEDVRTMDLQLQPFETTAVPTDAISNGTNDWQNTNPAAVSAHVNATRVLDFLFRILRRDSIDDEGMELINIVNCASSGSSNPPEWINAMWYQNMMWYGQQQTGGGFRSLSSYLDIIAHELFHGVTSHTANLVYSGQPGALNESFSDIFGIIIRNWHLAAAPGDVNSWTWDIGAGLGSGGNPMRNMADPSSVGRWRRPNPAGGGSQIVNGYPDHMNQYVALPLTRFYDWGGVHWFSNIHNFAAHKVLNSQRTDNSHVFSPEEVAILYYLVLTRLTRLSDFGDVRTELLVVSDTIYAGNAARSLEANAAITKAYDDVGIV